MRASPLFVTAGAAAAWLLLAATAPSGASAAEYYQRTPRDGQGPLPISQWYQTPIVGKSTYYGPYLGGGSCGLDQPDGSAVPPEIQGIDWTVAIDREQFYQGGCGMCLELTGTGVGSGGNPVTGVYHVFVNNQCPECEFGHLDVALPGDGLWDITWKAVPCNVGGHNMRFVFKGSNEYYLKLGTQATKVPTKRLRLKLDGQEWADGAPVNGAYFEFREGAPFRFPMEVEVTSVFDEVLTDTIGSIEGGRSNIQYSRTQPTDEEIDKAEPGEEPETDDDIEEDAPTGTAGPSVVPPLPKPQQHHQKPKAPKHQHQPTYEALSLADAAEEAEYQFGPHNGERRRPFLGEEEEEEEEEEEDGEGVREEEDEEASRWEETQYLRGRGRRRGA